MSAAAANANVQGRRMLVGYVMFGIAWILASDTVLAALVPDPDMIAPIGAVKGIVFVLISATWFAAALHPGAAPAGPSEQPHPGRGRLLGLLSVALLTIPIVDFAILRVEGAHRERTMRAAQQRTATARADQIGQWLEERYTDAEHAARAPWLFTALGAASGTTPAVELERNLRRLVLEQRYEGARLLARDGTTIASAGQFPERTQRTNGLEFGRHSHPHADEHAPRVQATALLHWSDERTAHIGIRVPVADGRASRGWLELQLPSPSLFVRLAALDGSTIALAGSDGGDTLLLGPLPDRPGELGVVRAPRAQGAAAEVALTADANGSARAVDSAGIDILAGYARLPGSDWRVLVTTAASVFDGALMSLLVWVNAILLAGIGSIALVLNMLWRAQRQVEAMRAASLHEVNERLLRQMFGLPFIGVAFTSTGNSQCITCNDRLCEILGYGRDELSKICWPDITHPEDRAADAAAFDGLLAGRCEGYRLEKRFIRRDGEIVHARVDMHCVRRVDGAIETLVAAIDDITADVRQRQALQASQARCHDIVAAVPVPTIVHADDGTVVAVNRAWYEASGYRDDGTPRHVADWLALFHPPERVAAVAAAIAAAHERPGPFDAGDFAIRHCDGSERIWHFSDMPLVPGEDGRKMMVTSAVDVTVQRAVERELRDSADLYRRMFETHPLCMYVWDDETGELLAVNDAMTVRYGWSRAELLAMRCGDLRPAERRDASDAALRDGIAAGSVVPHRRNDGSLMQVELTAHAMRFGEHAAWLTMAIDVTEREAARAERDGYVRRLEAATDSTFRVISTMVEVRDPYTAGHERRVGEIAVALAARMGLSEHVQKGLRLAGTVHDVGKIGVPSEILCKPTRLSAAEYQLVQQHAALGYEILRSIDLPWPIAEVARQHHEAFDGSGYPRGLRGDGILLESRIVAVADVIESMASHRPYRAGLGLPRALAEVEAQRGKKYDPDVVDACLSLFRETAYTLPE